MVKSNWYDPISNYYDLSWRILYLADGDLGVGFDAGIKDNLKDKFILEGKGIFFICSKKGIDIPMIKISLSDNLNIS